MKSACLPPLILSASYLVIYVAALLLLLTNSKYRFTVQIKVILCALFAALCLQTASFSIALNHAMIHEDETWCEGTDFSYMWFNIGESLILLIYMYVVSRMLYIYTQLLANSSYKSCALRVARFITRHEKKIIGGYFALRATLSVVGYFGSSFYDPDVALTRTGVIEYMIFSLINLIVEIAVGVTFCMLWYFFAKLYKQPGFSTEVTRRQSCLVNTALIFISSMFIFSSICYDLIEPITTYRSLDTDKDIDWIGPLASLYYMRFLVDFISCMLIIYMLHRFGPSSS